MSDILTLYHGSTRPIDRVEMSRTIDGGFHCGTLAQARMRNKRAIHEVRVRIDKLRRCRDTGGGWKPRVLRARKAGFDAIVYLNRYEGMTAEIIENLASSGALSNFDSLSDAQARKLVPSLTDSYILLDSSRILSIELISAD